MISGLVYISLLNSRSFKFDLFGSGLFQGNFVLNSESKFRRLGLPHRGFRKESVAKNDFPWKSFLMNRWG